MIKNKLNFKLINFSIIILIMYLIYLTNDMWMGILNKVIDVLFPFFFSFLIAYFLNPIFKYLSSKKIPQNISIIILSIIFIFILFIIIINTFPLILNQLLNILKALIVFIKNISIKYNIESFYIKDNLNNIINNSINYISNSTFSIIDIIFNFISKFIIIIVLTIYFSLYMNNIKKYIVSFFKNRNDKLYNYCFIIIKELKLYNNGFIKIIIITFFEYLLFYFIIGHPNFFIIAVLASLANIIPYFGGLFVNLLAIITACMNSKLLIRTILLVILLSIIDSYVINPIIYKNSNKLNPLVIIGSTIIFGKIFNIFGILFSIPLTIITIETFKYLKMLSYKR